MGISMHYVVDKKWVDDEFCQKQDIHLLKLLMDLDNQHD